MLSSPQLGNTTDNEQQPGPPLSLGGTCPVVPSQLAGTLRDGSSPYLISRSTWESLDFRGAWGISRTTNRVQAHRTPVSAYHVVPSQYLSRAPFGHPAPYLVSHPM